jgi:tetratricopeptide (TPR) repeat protein
LPVPETADVNLESNSAVTLFVQRASQASRDFTLETEDREALVRICKMVGGLPLAIELAASWVRILSCHEIAQELEASLDLLETKKIDVPLRHRSIRTVFDHSWILLTPEEQTILKSLSIFQGGFTREAATSVTGASLSNLSSFIDKSLLRYSKSRDRYDMHELIRQYTYSQFVSDPIEAEQQAAENHATYYASWIADLESSFKSALQSQISQLIRSETANWLAGWHWAVENKRLGILRKMSPCLNWYFEVHGNYDEALSVFKGALEEFRALGAPDCLESPEERSNFASIVNQVGWFEYHKGNVEAGESLLVESLEIAREYDDPEILYYIYGNWGHLSLTKGDIQEAERYTRESLSYAQKLNSPWHTALPLSVLGIVAYQQGKFDEAFQQLTKSLEHWRSVGDPRGLVFCMLYLSMTAFIQNNFSFITSMLLECNEIAAGNMDHWAHAFGLDMLGMVALAQGKNEEALNYFNQSNMHSNEIGDQLRSTQTKVHIGQAHAALGSCDEAINLYREAYTVAQQAKWTLTIMSILVSFAEMNSIPPEAKLALVLSILLHPGVSPHMRARSEKMRDELVLTLTSEQVKTSKKFAKEKNPEDWARELLG